MSPNEQKPQPARGEQFRSAVVVLLLWVMVLAITVQNLQQPSISTESNTVYVSRGVVFATNADHTWEKALFPVDEGCALYWQNGDVSGMALMARGTLMNERYDVIVDTGSDLPADSQVVFRFDSRGTLEVLQDYPQVLLYNDETTISLRTECNQPLPPTLYVVYVENNTLYIANTHTLKRVELMPVMEEILWSGTERRVIDRDDIASLYAEPSGVAWLVEGAEIIGMFEAIPFVEVYQMDVQHVLLRASFGDIVLLSYDQ